MKRLTPSIYTFEDMIKGDFLYIDKTEYIGKLVLPYKGIYFLSRPRRFGKSLTHSTLKAIFQGKRELFKGLSIANTAYDWKKYPIIHLDFGNCDAKTPEELREYLLLKLRSIAQQAGLYPTLSKEQLGQSFLELIVAMNQGNGVVILVDEYDKPILNHLGNEATAQEMLSVLKGFYSAIKTGEPEERFVFISGVTKFCHVSLFSDLNNLQDISSDNSFATMLGYTQKELENDFSAWLAQSQKRLSLSSEDLLKTLKLWYDGYRFSPEAETVYNPVSIACFFMQGGSFKNYWFSTGTTGSLFQLMQKFNCRLPQLVEQPVMGELFDSFELSTVDIQKLMYQTGYLTIGETDAWDIPGMPGAKQFQYHLRFPNYEVKSSFNNQIMAHYAGLKDAEANSLARQLAADVQCGDIEDFMERLKVLFARIPYNLHGHQEHDYQTIIFVIFMMLNVYIEGEHHTNEGRIDLLLYANNWTYVIELKLNQSAQDAMTQIAHKDYARGFLKQGRHVLAVGVNFNAKRAQIDNWLAEEITE